jgi:hypothetical protein
LTIEGRSKNSLMRGQARAIEQGRVACLRGKHLRVIAVKIAIWAIATKAGLHGFAVEMIGPLWVFRATMLMWLSPMVTGGKLYRCEVFQRVDVHVAARPLELGVIDALMLSVTRRLSWWTC